MEAAGYLLGQSGEGTPLDHIFCGYSQKGLWQGWEQLQREILPPADRQEVEESLTPLEEKSSSGFSGSLDKLCAALLQFPLSLPSPQGAFMSLPLPWAAKPGDEKPAVSLRQSYLPFAHKQAEVKCHVLALAIICSVLIKLTFPLYRQVLPPWALVSLLPPGQGPVTGPALPVRASGCAAWKGDIGVVQLSFGGPDTSENQGTGPLLCAHSAPCTEPGKAQRTF